MEKENYKSFYTSPCYNPYIYCVTLLDHEIEVEVFNWSPYFKILSFNSHHKLFPEKIEDIKLGIFRFLQL